MLEKQKLIGKKIKLKNDLINYNKKIDRIIDSLVGAKYPRLKRDTEGNIIRPHDISQKGKPLYFEISHGDNLFSSVKAEALKTGGRLGLDLNGNGITVGIWDYGAILSNHEEFINPTTGINAINIDQNESQKIQDNHQRVFLHHRQH